MDGQLKPLKFKVHPQNVEGPFYVRNGECMACGAPEIQAPTMMSHDERGHCFFVRQPSTEDETDEAILGLWVSCCGAVRYQGLDREILTRLSAQGLADQCDYQLDETPKRVVRNCMCFEFRDAESEKGKSAVAHEIMDFFAHSLPTQIADVRDFKCSAGSSSFRYEWGGNSQPHPHSTIFILEPQNEPETIRNAAGEVSHTYSLWAVWQAGMGCALGLIVSGKGQAYKEHSAESSKIIKLMDNSSW